MATSLAPVTVSGNVAPINRIDEHMGRKSQEIELATWHLFEGAPVNVWIMARGKRPNRGLRFRLNVEIANPALLLKQKCDAILTAHRDALADAFKTGVLECKLVGFAESPAVLLATAEKLANDGVRDFVRLFTFNWPTFELKFALMVNAEICKGVSDRFQTEAIELQNDLDIDAEEEEETDQEESADDLRDFADDVQIGQGHIIPGGLDDSGADLPPLFGWHNRVEFPQRGATFRMRYPTDDRHGIESAMTTHRLRFIEINDRSERPFTIPEFLKRRKRIIGQWGVMAWDAEKWDRREFFLDWDNPPALQMGHYDPASGKCEELIGRPYQQTKADLEELAGVCRELLKTPLEAGDRLTLAIFAVPKAKETPPLVDQPEKKIEPIHQAARIRRAESLNPFDDGAPDIIAITKNGAALLANGDITRLSLNDPGVGA